MTAQDTTDRGIVATIHARRSVRQYRPERVSEETIHRLLEMAVQAPTAMHLEPWGFVVVQDRALLKRYSDRAKAMLRETKLADMGMLSDPDFNIFYDAGTLIVICARTAGPFAEADCWLAAQNLMLAATARQLATCCIGFAVPVLNAPDVKRELGVPADGIAVAPVILGFPQSAAAPVPRKAPHILCWKK
jgi:nitroreductase